MTRPFTKPPRPESAAEPLDELSREDIARIYLESLMEMVRARPADVGLPENPTASQVLAMAALLTWDTELLTSVCEGMEKAIFEDVPEDLLEPGLDVTACKTALALALNKLRLALPDGGMH